MWTAMPLILMAVIESLSNAQASVQHKKLNRLDNTSSAIDASGSLSIGNAYVRLEANCSCCDRNIVVQTSKAIVLGENQCYCSLCGNWLRIVPFDVRVQIASKLRAQDACLLTLAYPREMIAPVQQLLYKTDQDLLLAQFWAQHAPLKYLSNFIDMWHGPELSIIWAAHLLRTGNARVCRNALRQFILRQGHRAFMWEPQINASRLNCQAFVPLFEDEAIACAAADLLCRERKWAMLGMIQHAWRDNVRLSVIDHLFYNGHIRGLKELRVREFTVKTFNRFLAQTVEPLSRVHYSYIYVCASNKLRQEMIHDALHAKRVSVAAWLAVTLALSWDWDRCWLIILQHHGVSKHVAFNGIPPAYVPQWLLPKYLYRVSKTDYMSLNSALTHIIEQYGKTQCIELGEVIGDYIVQIPALLDKAVAAVGLSALLASRARKMIRKWPGRMPEVDSVCMALRRLGATWPATLEYCFEHGHYGTGIAAYVLFLCPSCVVNLPVVNWFHDERASEAAVKEIYRLFLRRSTANQGKAAIRMFFEHFRGIPNAWYRSMHSALYDRRPIYPPFHYDGASEYC